MSFLDRAIKDGYANITGVENKQKITYVSSDNHTENYNDPEEKVRAEFWAELIYEYDYPAHRIKVEVTIPDRIPTDRADIVIFSDDECKKPYAVVECKRDGVTDAEFLQAIEQGVGNATWVKLRAKYVVIIAGATRRVLDFSDDNTGIFERETNIIADLPKSYGKPQEFRFYKGGVYKDADGKQKNAPDIQAVAREDLIAAIKKCHNTLWGGGRLSPPTAFGELCKLIFVKISDEQKPRKKGEPYQFQIKTHEPSSKLAERINALYDEQKVKDPEVFTDSIKVDDRVLRTVVSHLEAINLSKTDLDVKGVAFEQFMDGFFKGDFGQYFTPREIIQFTVKMMKPEHDWDVLDPACGSGGFLLYALDYMRKKADQFYDKDTEPTQHRDYWHNFAKEHLFGIEINDEIARVAKMNMIVHDDGHTNVISCDALDSIDKMHEHNRGFEEGKFKLILTNPPFGSSIKKAEKPYLSGYELGKTKNIKGKEKDRPQQSSEILFIERIWDFLESGKGKAAIVLPDGVLTNSSSQYVRDFIIEKFQILAIVSLPQYAFTHFGAGVKASIVFIRKRKRTEAVDSDEKIFMSTPEYIGYDATGAKISENQLDEIVYQYEKHLAGNSVHGLCYTVPLKSILNNSTQRLDPKCYNEKYEMLKAKIAATKFKCYRLRNLIIDITNGDWGSSLDSGSVDNTTKCLVLRATEFDNKHNYCINDSKVQYRRIDNKKLEQMKVEIGDIIIEKSGGSKDQPVGRVIYVDRTEYNDVPIAYSNFLTKIRANKELIDPYYLFEYLRFVYNMGITEVMQNQTNGIRNLIINEFLDQIVIVPDNNKDIGQKMLLARNKSIAFEKQASKVMNDAKTEFENELLGE